MTKELEEEGIEFADAWQETWYVGSNAKYQAMGRRDKGTELRFSFSEKKEMGIADETEMEDWKETFFSFYIQRRESTVAWTKEWTMGELNKSFLLFCQINKKWKVDENKRKV